MTVFHEVETKDGVKEVELTRSKAIRLKCLECSNWSAKEVRMCTIPTCALYPYRVKLQGSEKIVREIQENGEYYKEFKK
jgi:hypothetical protein